MFGKRLNIVRHEKKITAQQMADQLRVSLRNYRFYESGRYQPSLETLVRIADHLDVSVDYLLGRDEFLARQTEKILHSVQNDKATP